jgi:hypothetical protein
MNKIAKIIITVFVVYVTYTAYKESQVNGKSIWYNIGHQFNNALTKSVKKIETIVSDLDSGLKK